ncbi:CDP-alcohol phosphatidyltransferase family protein [Candidatus Dojkabacteria bacterium]|nr:CDP-alcohol phosphatidyltransferase family protein [Candidatus Dojkabacteria bacterium]
MFSKLKSVFEPLLNILIRPFLWISPNVMSMIAFSISAGSGIALAIGKPRLAAILFVGNILDSFDGQIARKTGRVTKFGGLLDTNLDRLAEAVFFFGAAYGGYISFEIAFIAIVASVMVSFVKAVATAAMGETKVGTNALSVGIGQRGDRLFLLFLGTLFIDSVIPFTSFNSLEIMSGLVVLTSVITFFWRLIKANTLLKGQ